MNTLRPKTFVQTQLTRGTILATLVLIAGCTAIPTSLEPVSVPLYYQTMASAGEFPSFPSCAGFSAIQVTDGRLDKNIGKRFVETNPSITAPISAASDVAGWARTGAAEAAQKSGIAQKSSGPVLRITVRQIVVSENVARRSGFEGRIQLAAELVRKGGGVCWQDRFEGTSENYGYSGRNDNYQETLNHALDRAMIRLLSDPGFQRKNMLLRRLIPSVPSITTNHFSESQALSSVLLSDFRCQLSAFSFQMSVDPTSSPK